METSEAGRAFIEQNEELRLTVYNDNGKPAIGYGHDLLSGENFSDGITTLQAQMLLEQDVNKVEAALNPRIPASCTQNQYDALVDFGFNLGVAALETMLGHGWEQVPTQMLRWVHKKIDGVEISSKQLTERRKAEVALFES